MGTASSPASTPGRRFSRVGLHHATRGKRPGKGLKSLKLLMPVRLYVLQALTYLIIVVRASTDRERATCDHYTRLYIKNTFELSQIRFFCFPQVIQNSNQQ